MTLIILPIIIGVALGYFILLLFVASYRKITGEKSREEKESEVAKKIRIVMENDLLDKAFMKSKELPVQKPKILWPFPRTSSYRESQVSRVDKQSLSESESEESIEEMEGQSFIHCAEIFHEEMQVAVKDANDLISQKQAELNVTDDVISSEVANISRGNSASSGHYSTANEMIDSDSSDISKEKTSVSKKCNISGDCRFSFQTAEEQAGGNGLLEMKNFDKLQTDVTDESGFFEECSSKIRNLRIPTIETENDVTIANATVEHCKTTYQPRENISSHSVDIPPFLGKLRYSVNYFEESNELHVTIIKAIDLSNEYKENTSEPSTFVRVSLLPQKFCWQKTKVISQTRNPVYNETFVISGFSHQRFSKYNILITVVNAVVSDQNFLEDQVIGELCVPLSHVINCIYNKHKAFCQWAELKSKFVEVSFMDHIHL